MRMTIGNQQGTTRIGSPQLNRNQQHKWSNWLDHPYLQMQTNISPSSCVLHTWIAPHGLGPLFKSFALSLFQSTATGIAAAALINLHFATRSVVHRNSLKAIFSTTGRDTALRDFWWHFWEKLADRRKYPHP